MSVALMDGTVVGVAAHSARMVLTARMARELLRARDHARAGTRRASSRSSSASTSARRLSGVAVVLAFVNERLRRSSSGRHGLRLPTRSARLPPPGSGACRPGASTSDRCDAEPRRPRRGAPELALRRLPQGLPGRARRDRLRRGGQDALPRDRHRGAGGLRRRFEGPASPCGFGGCRQSAHCPPGPRAAPPLRLARLRARAVHLALHGQAARWQAGSTPRLAVHAGDTDFL